jgi:hypothetical protein
MWYTEVSVLTLVAMGWGGGPFIKRLVVCKLFSFLFGMGWNRVSPLLLRRLLARIVDDDECGAVGVMLSKGNRSTRRKPAPVPLCPPQIPHGLTQARTRATSVGSRRLAAWAKSRPFANLILTINFYKLYVMSAIIMYKQMIPSPCKHLPLVAALSGEKAIPLCTFHVGRAESHSIISEGFQPGGTSGPRHH